MEDLPYKLGTIKLTWINPTDYTILESKMFDSVEEALKNIPPVDRYVLTSGPSELALFAAPELEKLTKAEVFVLDGGNKSWTDNGLELEKGATHLASPPLDRYKRPYEGTSVDPKAMQAYLDWEFGLVEQLGKDGTHHFWVL